jgi:hypothetical protein
MKKYIIAFAILICIASCTPVKYVPVESVRLDSTYIYKVQRDSVHLRDSIFVLVKGDTVYQYRDRYLYRDRQRVDTFYVNRTDTIRIPYPVEIEKKLSWWQQLKVKTVGWLFSGALVIVGWLVYKKRNR